MTAALVTRSLSMRFGGLTAVCDLDLAVDEGSIFGVIGPNGAGKTTVFNMLTGVYRPSGGSIQALGRNLIGKRPYEICALGISRTFQNIRLFKELSVLDNLIIAMDGKQRSERSVFGNIFRSPRFVNTEARKHSEAFTLLGLVGLADRHEQIARNLPYGGQRRLEIARALATGAKIVLLDEPAAGMTATEKDELIEMIKRIRTQFGLTVILIEHDMDLVMGLCERIAVLDYGKKIAEGTPREVQCDPAVLEAYLGRKDSGEEKK